MEKELVQGWPVTDRGAVDDRELPGTDRWITIGS
jgi:hypothetical protein